MFRARVSNIPSPEKSQPSLPTAMQVFLRIFAPPQPELLQSSSFVPGKSFISVSSSVSCTGDETTYCPLAHLPRSINRQRSLQKGKSSADFVTAFLQIGHLSLSLGWPGTSQL